MPKETIKHIEADESRGARTLQIGWNKIGWVQLSVAPDGWKDTGDWEIIDLFLEDIERLIRVSRRAKRQSFSREPTRAGKRR